MSPTESFLIENKTIAKGNRISDFHCAQRLSS